MTLKKILLSIKQERKKWLNPVRLQCIFFERDYNISFPSIGQKLGGRDHTTVIHSCEKIKEEIKNNPGLIRELTEIRSML